MGRRFLVVEDNPKNFRLVQMVLRAAGHEVAHAGDGEEAVARVLEDPPDVVLMDVQLPRLSGVEALRILQQQHGVTLPVIALTAYAMKPDRENFLAMGFAGYITKPIDTRAFVGQVEAILASPGPPAGKERTP